ncbi:MAG: 4-hydroxythreonine-4-phosphate dehydrogenase [Chloroflexi bacterium]|nr:MAG: 4-hydroxythreonine-4-phosphate dehydrogenase [Chloroflexota bacterium]
MTSNPIIAITLGDPAGIGPEVIVKALPERIAQANSRPIVIGDARIVRDAAQRWLDGWTVRAIDDPAASPTNGVIHVLDMANCDPARVRVGTVDPYTGEAAYQAVVRAAELAIAGSIDAIVTAPLNKAAMHLAGHPFDGHTVLLGHLCGTRDYFMLLAAPRLRAIHVSTHISLAEAVQRVTRARVLATIHAAHGHLRQLGIDEPRIGVCGLNPHAGESRLFGDQDEDEIRPACDAAAAAGLHVAGPLPADAAFRHAYEGKWDILVVMYHDQGHVPMKLIAFDDGVNVTVGLPIIRTSVEHGTAFDIAGQGVASAVNMQAAIAYAHRLATGGG